ncbi:hypothetical protein ANANG_G00183860 [Anguilla anguilla]|uniref:Uncharacterized protein n=1 Tax=Anguilla anguilla TaxID=7936 RepID=A0A9D3M8W4_ANGAN|nr:hypothetical protein ANANG_G00183860 [Anguilla anguilla]
MLYCGSADRSSGFVLLRFCLFRLRQTLSVLLDSPGLPTPAVAVATALCVCGLFHRRVRSPATCSNRVSNNDIIKEENLHYASLHLPNKPKKSRQRETPPLSGDITYASVALQPPTNQNC